MHTWFWFSAVSMVFFGITGVTQKLSTNNISFELSFVWFCIAMITVSVLTALLVPLNWQLSMSLFLGSFGRAFERTRRTDQLRGVLKRRKSFGRHPDHQSLSLW